MREHLVEEFGEDTASMAGKMIVGFSPQGSRQSAALLSACLDALTRGGVGRDSRLACSTRSNGWTGRDDQGYDPDHPEGKGLAAWVDLERQGKLNHATPPRAKAK